MKRQLLSLGLAAALLLTAAGCSTSTGADSGNAQVQAAGNTAEDTNLVISGRITAIDGDSVTLQLENRPPNGAPQGDEAPQQVPQDGTLEEPLEAPKDDTPQVLPNDATTTLDLSGVTFAEDSTKTSFQDLALDDILTVEMDEKGNITSVAVREIPQPQQQPQPQNDQ